MCLEFIYAYLLTVILTVEQELKSTVYAIKCHASYDYKLNYKQNYKQKLDLNFKTRFKILIGSI